ncbi:MAG TPA: penicillin acylase family protein [Thermoanaerobaculia bacterium]|nr:penicillin acylase family protein [Thermoanaerobaculia bacterium]
MKRKLWQRLVKWTALALALVVVAGALALAWMVRRPWPEVDGEVALAGLRAPVEVIRDRWGVPHLYAETERDLFLAQGYVHAQDRLWQMEFNRLVASGSLGSLLGPALLDADRYLRTIGLRRAAERDWRELGPRGREVLEAYAAGVNLFLESHRERLPLEFTLLRHEPAPWTPVDSLAWGKLMSLNLSMNHPYEILRSRLAGAVGPERAAELMAGYPQDAPVIVSETPWRRPDGEGAAGERAARRSTREGGRLPELLAALVPAAGGRPWASNSWAVHGSRTATGAPILANDTHLGLQMPSVWYENGLHGGRLDVVGFSFPGLPLVVIGQNRRIAWGITNMCSDVQDLFVERLDDPERPTRYRFGDEWRPLERRRERIELAGAEPAEVEVLATHHGPLINGIVAELAEAEPMALAWTAHGAGGRIVESLLALDLAGDWQSFRAALAGWEAPSVNFTYADADGHIGYQGTGRVPIRPPGDSGLAPKPGWTGEAEWLGFIPYDELPRALDPPAGFVVTANNRTAGDGYPHFIAVDMADPYRAERITRVLAADPEVTVADVRALQADVLSMPGSRLAEHLAALEPRSPREERALAAVRAWDRRVAADSPGAALYQVWFYFLWSQIFGDELGPELIDDYRFLGIAQAPFLVALMAAPDSPWFDDVATPEREDRDAILGRALTEAVDWLGECCGDDPAGWRWGELHRVTFAHAPLGQSGIAPLEWLFNPRSRPAPGDIFTVNEGTPDLLQPFGMTFGVSQRLIADLADPARSLAVNSTGQSGHALHRHRDDQIPLWSAVDYHPVLFDREAALAVAEGRLLLVPAAE